MDKRHEPPGSAGQPNAILAAMMSPPSSHYLYDAAEDKRVSKADVGFRLATETGFEKPTSSTMPSKAVPLRARLTVLAGCLILCPDTLLIRLNRMQGGSAFYGEAEVQGWRQVDFAC